MATILGIFLLFFWSERVACASGATKVTTILGIFPRLVLVVLVVGFYIFAWVPK